MKKRPTYKNRPLGSGVFALVVGVLFILTSLTIYLTEFDVTSLDPTMVLNIYLIAGGALLVGWGINRVIYNDGRWIIAQNTMNFVLAILATAIAILSLLIAK